MDPNTVYANMIAAALELERLADSDDVSRDEVFEVATELAADVIALNTWIRKGGFLPTAWESKVSK